MWLAGVNELICSISLYLYSWVVPSGAISNWWRSSDWEPIVLLLMLWISSITPAIHRFNTAMSLYSHVATSLTHRDVCWSLHWTSCHNVWWWSGAGVGCTVVGTRVGWSHTRTEENGGPVHLPDSYYTVNSGTTAVSRDTPTRTSPRVGHCHWGVYPWVQHGDAGEVERSGGVDASGGGAYDVHPRSWN